MKKKIIIAAFLLAALSGCQNDPSTGLFNGTSRRTLETTIIGRLSQADTKTELGDNGIIKWCEGDSIGLFNASFSNVGARLDNASAGSTEGIFKAGMAGKAMYAYYPYSSNAKVTRTTVALNLPATQIQNGENINMQYDFKVGSYVSGTAAEGLVMEFTEKLALLNFAITPLDVIVGDKLESVIFTSVVGHPLAGNFTLNLNSAVMALEFAEGSPNTVELKFAGKPVLTEGQIVNGWMFVNPSVKFNEHIRMTVRTDKHIVTVDINTELGFKQGYRYRLPLDLPTLKSRGYVSIQEKEDEFDVTTLENPGIYDITNEAYKVKYEEGVNQYATGTASGKNNFRIQSLPQGYAVTVQTPSTLDVDSVCDVVVSKIGSIDVATGTFSAKVIKKEGGICWMYDETDKRAYVIIM